MCSNCRTNFNIISPNSILTSLANISISQPSRNNKLNISNHQEQKQLPKSSNNYRTKFNNSKFRFNNIMTKYKCNMSRSIFNKKNINCNRMKSLNYNNFNRNINKK